jgi:hypothetical protein
LFFDEYSEIKSPEDFLAWIEAGANPDDWRIPNFYEDLQSLRQGNSVTTRRGERVGPCKYLVVERPFGISGAGMRGLVDFLVCIDLPTEIAVARNILRNVKRRVAADDAEKNRTYLHEHHDLLEIYLFNSGREMYLNMVEKVKQDCDLILDGTQPVNELARQVMAALPKE